jgi:hypothetical protein
MATNKEEYERLGEVLRGLNGIIANTSVSNAVARPADRVRTLVRNERFAMLSDNLDKNSGSYTVLTKDQFRDKILVLRQLKSDVEALTASTAQVVQVVGWLAALIPLLA